MNPIVSISVSCEPYGIKTLTVPVSMKQTANGKALLAKIENSWNQYWLPLFETSQRLANEIQGIYDFKGDLDHHPFRIEVFDLQRWKDPDYLVLQVIIEAPNPMLGVPIFTAEFKGFEVVHSQPSW